MTLTIVGDEEIFKSVVIEVADARTLSPTELRQSSFFGHSRKGAVPVVSIELITGLPAFWKAFESAGRDEENIRITVIVVIDEGDSVTQGLENVFFELVAAAVEGIFEAGFQGYVHKLDWRRRSCSEKTSDQKAFPQPFHRPSATAIA